MTPEKAQLFQIGMMIIGGVFTLLLGLILAALKAGVSRLWALSVWQAEVTVSLAKIESKLDELSRNEAVHEATVNKLREDLINVRNLSTQRRNKESDRG